MGLFSFLRKNKQEASQGQSEFYSRAEEDAGKPRRRRKQGKSADPADDPVLPEKKRARRRLVGAVALVLAAVIGLPMILDSEPKPIADDIAIQIPSRDKPVSPVAPMSQSAAPVAAPRQLAASATLDGKEEIVEIPPPVAPAEPAGLVVPKDDKPAEAKSTEAVKPNAPEKAPAASAKSSAKTEAKPEPSHQSNAARPVEKSVEKSDDARALAILEGKSDTKPTDKKPEKIVLQIGAFATQAKIDEVRGKLKKAGIPAYTEKVPAKTGDVTRIRVGPLASKDEAARMRARLVKLGFDAKTVTN